MTLRRHRRQGQAKQHRSSNSRRCDRRHDTGWWVDRRGSPFPMEKIRYVLSMGFYSWHLGDIVRPPCFMNHTLPRLLTSNEGFTTLSMCKYGIEVQSVVRTGKEQAGVPTPPVPKLMRKKSIKWCDTSSWCGEVGVRAVSRDRVFQIRKEKNSICNSLGGSVLAYRRGQGELRETRNKAERSKNATRSDRLIWCCSVTFPKLVAVVTIAYDVLSCTWYLRRRIKDVINRNIVFGTGVCLRTGSRHFFKRRLILLGLGYVTNNTNIACFRMLNVLAN